jgi:hypothetical protein
MTDDIEPYVDAEDKPYPFYPPFIEGVSGFHFDGPATRDIGGGGVFLPHHEYVARYDAKTKETGQDWGGHLLSSFLNDMDEEHDHGRHDGEAYSFAPYCWCEGDTCRFCNDDVAPFFHWKATDLRVRWYKHPARGLRANRAWTAAEVAAMRAAIGLKERV